MGFSKVQLVTVGAIIGIGLFNPMSVAVLRDYFEWFYTGVFVLCSVWVVGFLLKKVLTPERVNIPTKSSKTKKAGKLIET